MKAFHNLKGKVDAIRHPPPPPPPPEAPQEEQAAAAAPPPSSPRTSTNSGKRGLCWPLENNNNNDPIHPFTKPSSKISWLYNWSPNPSPNASCSLEWIPMTWNTSNLPSEISKIRDSHAPCMLSFNEPELPDQSNISVDQAVEEWLRYVEPLRKEGRVRCGSPGISNAGHAVGWLGEFLGKVREGGGDVDFLCLHWYGVDLGGFYDYIWSTHHQLDPSKPVWITEFAATNWNKDDPLPREHVENFAKESCKYLDTLDWVERYAWFGPMRDPGTVGKWAAMIGEDGDLTALGKAYRDE